ncbi:ankyrin repeat domain-containing protein 1-like [Periplaneta americana]|uniref:ankyrin repeat domain-containing protein 1-like n=1 Tax=Periplaneta americana TaxID=6978 RepID=UPI0037E735D3
MEEFSHSQAVGSPTSPMLLLLQLLVVGNHNSMNMTEESRRKMEELLGRIEEEELSRQQAEYQRLLDQNQRLQDDVVKMTEAYNNLTAQNQRLQEKYHFAHNRLAINYNVNLTERLMCFAEQRKTCQSNLEATRQELTRVTLAANAKQSDLEEATNRLQQLSEQIQQTQSSLEEAIQTMQSISKEFLSKEADLNDIKAKVEVFKQQPEKALQLFPDAVPLWQQQLFAAAKSGDERQARLLLLLGADPNAREGGYANGTPLHRAAGAGQTGVARELLSTEGTGVDPRDNFGDTPLHWAAERGHSATCRLLLNRGADVNAVTHYRNTPLHLAAQGGHLDVVRILMAKDARFDALNHKQLTPLQLAQNEGRFEVVEYFMGLNNLMFVE